MSTPTEKKMCKRCGLVTGNLKSRYCARCGHDQFGNVQDEKDSAAWEDTQITGNKNSNNHHTNNKASDIIMTTLGVVFAFVLLLLLAFVLLNGRVTITANDLNNVFAAPTKTAKPTNPPTSDDMALNESTSVEPLKDPLWDDYYKCGVQIDNDQNKGVWYSQSGKNGRIDVKGTVLKDQVLAIDALTLIKDGTEYNGGCILLLRGPLDLDKYKITIVNGAAQLVPASHVQEFLDYNMSVKFARGDWNKYKGEFSYQPWALKKDQIWVLDYTYTSLVGKLNADNDSYPR